MTRPQVVDGRIAHANGAFPLVLQGDERLQAHLDIMKSTDSLGFATGRRAECDRAAAAIIRRDPSLLLEPIPRKHPVKGPKNRSWVTSDAVWANHREWYGTWLARLSHPDIRFVESVRAALDAGIHPDDSTVWPEGTLLATEGWCLTPNQLSVALDHGANPTLGKGFDDSYLRAVLVHIRFLAGEAVWDESSRLTFADAMTCAELLVDAGTQELDTDLAEPGPDGRLTVAQRATSALGLLLDGKGMGHHEPGARDRIFRLVGKLQAAGVDIDQRNGIFNIPPVIQALRCANIDAACHLISLGCKTSDADVCRKGGPCTIDSVADEASRIGKDAFRTRIVDAVMKRQLAVSAGAARAAAPSPAPATRRRMTV